MGTAEALGARAVLQDTYDELDDVALDAKRAAAASRRRAQRARDIQRRLVLEAERLGFRLVISHGHSPVEAEDR